MKTIAVFDFDGTLTTRDSFIEFVRFTHGNLRCFCGLLLFAPLLVLMKLHLYPNWKVKERIFGYFFKGMPYDKFRHIGIDFAEKKGNILNLSTLESLSSHRIQGHSIYVITASMEEWVGPFFEGIVVLGTKPEVKDNGQLTGKFATKNCYGQEKVHRFLEMEPERDKYLLYAYGDSSGDRELLAFANSSMQIKRESIAGEFYRFCIVGLLATLIDAIIFYQALYFAPYQVALICGYIISLTFNYILTIKWTFNTLFSIKNAIGVFAAHMFNLFFVRMGLMYLFVSIVGINEKMAYMPTLLISVLSNFIIIRIFLKKIK